MATIEALDVVKDGPSAGAAETEMHLVVTPLLMSELAPGGGEMDRFFDGTTRGGLSNRRVH